MNEKSDAGGARSGVSRRNFAGGSLVAHPGQGEREDRRVPVEHGNALCLFPRLT